MLTLLKVPKCYYGCSKHWCFRRGNQLWYIVIVSLIAFCKTHACSPPPRYRSPSTIRIVGIRYTHVLAHAFHVLHMQIHLCSLRRHHHRSKQEWVAHWRFRCLYKVQQTLPSLTSFPVESASARYLMNPNSSSVSGFRVYVKALRFILPSNTDISVSHFKGHFWRICFCDASYKCPLPATSWEWAPSSDALFGRCCLLSRMCSLSISSDLNYWWNESIRLPSVRHDLGSRLLSLNSWINSSGMRLLNLILAAAAPVSAKRRTPSPTYN